MKIKEAQKFVKNFALNQNWDDHPNVDKFDHLHEELIEMSKFYTDSTSTNDDQ